MVCGPPTPEIIGLVVSVTVMVWLAVLVLPHASLAVQVRMMLLACGQASGVVTSAKLRLGFGSQLSLAAGSPKIGVLSLPVVRRMSTPEITGLVVSVTVMVWLAVLVLPHASLAVQV